MKLLDYRIVDQLNDHAEERHAGLMAGPTVLDPLSELQESARRPSGACGRSGRCVRNPTAGPVAAVRFLGIYWTARKCEAIALSR